MYHSDLSRRIAAEQREKMVSAVESAAVTLFGVVTAALLPQLLYQFLLAGDQLVEPPAFVQYIPHAGYALAALVFVNMVVGNFLRNRRIKLYSQELQMVSYLDEDCCGECSPEGMANDKEAGNLAEALMKVESKSSSKKKVSKKAPAKKAAPKKAAKKSVK